MKLINQGYVKVKGPKCEYNLKTHKGLIYFATDTNEILLDGKSYGSIGELDSYLTNYYKINEVDDLLNNIKDQLNNYPTKEEVSEEIGSISIGSGYATKEYVDNSINNRYSEFENEIEKNSDSIKNIKNWINTNQNIYEDVVENVSNKATKEDLKNIESKIPSSESIIQNVKEDFQDQYYVKSEVENLIKNSEINPGFTEFNIQGDTISSANSNTLHLLSNTDQINIENHSSDPENTGGVTNRLYISLTEGYTKNAKNGIAPLVDGKVPSQYLPTITSSNLPNFRDSDDIKVEKSDDDIKFKFVKNIPVLDEYGKLPNRCLNSEYIIGADNGICPLENGKIPSDYKAYDIRINGDNNTIFEESDLQIIYNACINDPNTDINFVIEYNDTSKFIIKCTSLQKNLNSIILTGSQIYSGYEISVKITLNSNNHFIDVINKDLLSDNSINNDLDYTYKNDRNSIIQVFGSDPNTIEYIFGDETGPVNQRVNFVFYSEGWNIGISKTIYVTFSNGNNLSIGHSFPVKILLNGLKNKFVPAVEIPIYTNLINLDLDNEVIIEPNNIYKFTVFKGIEGFYITGEQLNKKIQTQI